MSCILEAVQKQVGFSQDIGGKTWGNIVYNRLTQLSVRVYWLGQLAPIEHALGGHHSLERMIRLVEKWLRSQTENSKGLMRFELER